MPFDSNGTFSRIHNWQSDAAADIKIRADRHDQEDDNFAQGLSGVLTKDGRTQPTANLPMAGRKIVNLGAPVDPTDAVTKAYADAIKTYGSGLTLTGNAVDGRLTFTGTGVTGIGWTVTDIGFGVRPADGTVSRDRFVWNGEPDFSGTDGMVLTDAAQLGVGQVPPYNAGAGVYAGLISTDQSYAMNAYWSNADSKWHFLTAGFACLFTHTKTTGVTAIYRSDATGAADAVITWANLVTWNAAGAATFPSTVYASGAYLGTDGNVAGSIWLNYGTGNSDAYSAVVNRIENRCAAFRNTCVTSTRSAGYVGYGGSGGAGAYTEYAGYFISAVQKVSGDSYNMWFRQPQVYIANNGWIVAFPW